MTQDNIVVNIEISIPPNAIGEIPLVETMKRIESSLNVNDSESESSEDVDSVVVDETASMTNVPIEQFENREPDVRKDNRNSIEQLVHHMSGKATHYVLQGLRVSETKNGEDRFMTVKSLYNEIPLVHDRFRETNDPETYISSLLGSTLYKDGLVKRLPMVIDHDGRAPYGYRLTERGYEVCRRLGSPKNANLSSA